MYCTLTLLEEMCSRSRPPPFLPPPLLALLLQQQVWEILESNDKNYNYYILFIHLLLEAH